jgi:hypothetical protein
MTKKAPSKNPGKTTLKEIVLPVDKDLRVRLCCKRGACTGKLEIDPNEPPDEKGVLLCPECNGEFSSGMRGSLNGDRARLPTMILYNIARGAWCQTFGVELVRKV